MNGPGEPANDLSAALADIMELVPTRIAYIDAGERFRFANRAYVAWHGRGVDEVVGHTAREVLGETAYAIVHEHIRGALAGETQRFDTEIPYAERGARWVEVVYLPRRADDGRVHGFVVTVTDITDRKNAASEVERGRARIQHAFTQLPAIVSLALGPDHVLAAMSPSAIEALGPLAALGRPLRDVVEELGMGAPVLALYDRVYREGAVVRTPATHYVLHGRERVFDSTYQPLRDEHGGIEGVISFSLDVTERALAARRRDLLASVGSALAETRTPDATLACLADAVVPTLADRAIVHRRDEDGTVRRVVERASDAPAPTRDVAAIADVIDRAEAIASSEVIVVPLALGGGTRGALELTRAQGSGRVHASEDVALAHEIARLGETALDRAHAHAALEEARANDAFLAEAAHILSASLDVDETLRRIARLAVPMLGDLCVLGVVERDGRHRQVAEAADDDAQEARLRALRRWSEHPLAPIASAIERPGDEPAITELDDALVDRMARDPEELAILRELGARTSLAVPIAAHGRTLAVLHLGMARSGRRHGPRHRALAMRLAARAAISLENAHLYTEAREAATERARDAQRLRALADISRVFAEVSLDPELAYDAIARIAAQKLGDLAAINLLSHDGEWLETVALHHLDPAREALAHAIFTRPTPVEGSLNGEAVRTGKVVRMQHGPRDPHVATDAGRRYIDEAQAREVVAAPLEVRGRVIGTIAVTSEREGKSLDIELLEEIAHRAALLIENARLFRAAQDATRMRDELVATVSHELRTPLNAILGWAAIARARTEDATLITRALETIERNARAQAKLVDDLLDVARIVGGTMRLESADLEPELVARAAIDALRPAADARRVRIDLVAEDPCPRVRADASRLQQIVWNLVSNAVKFSRDDGHVRVTLRRNGDALEIVVEDDGIGIEPSFLPHVFERFRQARPTPGRGKGGVGLGLAIVRHLVEAHGGTVSVASDGRDRGTRFVVRLPARPDGADSATHALPEPSALNGVVRLDGVQVLLVEDDDDTREALRVALSAAGAEVVDARDGAEALRALDRAVPDVIVSDVAMPVLDGYGFLRAVRARPQVGGGNVPAIAMTAFARPEDAWRAREAGFQTHLAKPADPATVARAIAEMTPRRAR
ncbi:ATP-binding protein [Sandaracinus amylolyticus]|uniref:histidine kinase n=1 Tax=Sandaracinus amylolyticus TaxID=927083 RepID=A0A0F6W8P9_9BACT|nr:ATP-binding protein [Sandaracinus amylolyticus]AKF10177.1 Chemotaxis protein methyltransferase CheR [Sandaracinus amylolyticus]